MLENANETKTDLNTNIVHIGSAMQNSNTFQGFLSDSPTILRIMFTKNTDLHIQALTQEKRTLLHAIKGEDQPAHLRSLISSFVIHL